jgi:hypothetical protein
MRRRSWIPIALVLLIAAAILAAVLLRKNSPPEAARLLPEADGLVYINLKPLRALTHFDRKPVEHDPDYQAFIDATGIEVERDLEEAAFALSRRSDPNGPNGPLAYTEVFVGHFDGKRLADYLSKNASSKEDYADTDIFLIPHEGRTVRVALLGVDTVAASNTPAPEQIHAVLDRYHTAALSFTGSSLLKAHYRDVPLLSMAWVIGRSELVPLQQVLPVDAAIAKNSIIVASARYVRSLQLRIEEVAASPEAAKESAEQLSLLLQVLRAAQSGSDPDMQAMLQSVAVEHSGNRAVVKATIPVPLLEKTFGQPGSKAEQKPNQK